MQTKLPWWKWIVALVLSPPMIVWQMVAHAIPDIITAYRIWWEQRPWGK